MGRKSKNETVTQYQARTLAELVESGKELKEAEKEVGITLASLRNAGQLALISGTLMKRVEDAGLVSEERQKTLARAVLIEQMVQDVDPKLAQGAAKEILADGRATAQINITNNTMNVHYTPEILAAIKSLGLPAPQGEVIDVESE